MNRPEVSRCVLAACVVMATLTRSAAEPDPPGSSISSRLEIQGHRDLQKVRTRPGVTLAPFTTDGCSGGMSSVWTEVAARFPTFAEAHRDQPPWEACCVEHDRAYHSGGSDPDPQRSFQARLAADGVLRDCVRGMADERSDSLADRYGLTPEQVETAYGAIAEAMYLAVRVGGGPCSGLPWRWGYGYPNCGLFGGSP